MSVTFGLKDGPLTLLQVLDRLNQREIAEEFQVKLGERLHHF